MKCEECSLILDEYLDNELSETDVIHVFFHLGHCEKCAGICESLKRERQLYSSRLLNVKPDPGAWRNFQAGMKRHQQSLFYFFHRFKKLFAVPIFNFEYVIGTIFLFIIAVVIIRTVTYRFDYDSLAENTVSQNNNREHIQPSDKEYISGLNDKSDTSGSDDNKTANKFESVAVRKDTQKNIHHEVFSKRNSKPAASETIIRNQPLIEDVVDKSEREYLAAIAILTRDIKKQRKKLSSGMISFLEETLPELDQTIKETRQVVRTQPGDAIAVKYMTGAYARKVELLRMVAEN